MRRRLFPWILRISVLIIAVCLSGTALAGNFINASINTVIDKRTGLIWQTCSVQESVTDCSTSSRKSVTWSAAVAACEASAVDGKTDWRLPSRNELISLMDFSISPTVDTTIFTDLSSDVYWTSTHYQTAGNGNAYYANLDGVSTYQNKLTSSYAICVRSMHSKVANQKCVLGESLIGTCSPY